MSDILQAARSYYGLADIESCTTQLFTNQAGQACVAFEIPLSPADFLAIGERMKAMQEAESQPQEMVYIVDQKKARTDYEAMTQQQRGSFGSFGNYVHSLVEAGNKVAHIDAPETEEPTTMDAVWLEARDCSPAQMMHASDADLRSGRHLVPWSMLTEEQRQKAKDAKS